MVAVVLDLSQPAEALKSAVTWLQLVKTKLQSSFDWLEQRGSNLPEQLQLRARKYAGSSHDDKEAIQHLGQWPVSTFSRAYCQAGDLCHVLQVKSPSCNSPVHIYAVYGAVLHRHSLMLMPYISTSWLQQLDNI